jgi:general secretion pathway protein J
MRKSLGFTLVEVLVALLVMSIMAAMAWQGIDGIAKARASSESQVDRLLRLNSVLAQWEQDLASVQESQVVPALVFDGSTLRLTRRTDAGLQVVAWSLRDGAMLRWAAPAATGSRNLQEYWQRSLQLTAADAGQLRAIQGVSQWQLYFYRGNAWTNAQSSADLSAPAAAAAGGARAVQRQLLPAGVRVVLGFAPGSGFSGSLTRDIGLALQAQ